MDIFQDFNNLWHDHYFFYNFLKNVWNFNKNFFLQVYLNRHSFYEFHNFDDLLNMIDILNHLLHLLQNGNLLNNPLHLNKLPDRTSNLHNPLPLHLNLPNPLNNPGHLHKPLHNLLNVLIHPNNLRNHPIHLNDLGHFNQLGHDLLHLVNAGDRGGTLDDLLDYLLGGYYLLHL